MLLLFFNRGDHMQKKVDRIEWLDGLKTILMYLVVLGHSLLKFKKGKIFRIIYSFHMPLFLIISGFTFNPGKYKNITECVKDKLIKLIYPYIVLNLLVIPFWLINVNTGMIAKDSIFRILVGIFYSNSAVVRAPSNATWFLVTLFFSEIIYYSIHYFMKDNKLVFILSCIIALVGVIAPLGSEVIDAPFHLDVSLVGQFFIGCGYLLRLYFNDFVQLFQRYSLFKIVSFLFVGTFFALINKQVDLSNELYRNILYTLISVFSFSSVFFYVAQKIKKYPKVFSFIGQNTLIILAFHLPILRIIQAYFPIFLENQYYAILSSLIVFALMIPLIFLIKIALPFSIKMPNRLKQIIINF